MGDIEAERVREHVRDIETSETFVESERLRRFLRFTVESKLAGAGARVKEYVLGREVFDRPADYDPRLDPIVRVEARRLRRKLDEYYLSAGRDQAIRLSYPRGTYVPEIALARDAAPRTRSWRYPAVIAAGALVLLFALVAEYRTYAARDLMVAVIPMQWVQSQQPAADTDAIPIAEALTARIANLGGAPVVAWPTVRERRAQFTTLDATARALDAPIVVTVIAERSGRNDALRIFVVDTRTNRKLRAVRYVVPSRVSSYDAAAARIAADIQSSLP